MTLHEIQVLYPSPRRVTGEHPLTDPGYCVGGALCLMLSAPDTQTFAARFPSPSELGFALRHCNPQLTWRQGRNYANKIIDANDAEDFRKAWKILGRALTYTPRVKE